MKTFGERLSYAIRYRSVTQAEAAKKIGIAAPSLSQFISGVRKPSDRTILDICRVLNINEAWLRTGDGSMEQETPDTFTAELKRQYSLSSAGAKFINALAHALTVLSEEQQQKLTERLLEELQAAKKEEPVYVSNTQVQNAVDASCSEGELQNLAE